MKKKYIPPRMDVMQMETEANALLAGSGNPDTGMEIPKEPTPGVEGDAKEGFFDFEFYIDLPEE